jgi:hypothetical protein
MRTTWASVTSLAAVLLAIAGCYSTDKPRIKAPKRDDVYISPPANDPKWDKPIEFPKGTLNQDTIKQDQDSKDGPMKGPGSPKFGAGAGGGGY